MKKENTDRIYSLIKDCDYTYVSIDLDSLISTIKHIGCNITEEDLSKLRDEILLDYRLELDKIEISPSGGLYDEDEVQCDAYLIFCFREDR